MTAQPDFRSIEGVQAMMDTDTGKGTGSFSMAGPAGGRVLAIRRADLAMPAEEAR